MQRMGVTDQIGPEHVLVGDSTTVGMDDQITQREILEIGIGAGQLTRITTGVNWQIYYRMLDPGELHRRGRRGRGGQPVATIADHDLALVLQHHLIVLVQTQGTDQHDAGFILATYLAIHHLGVTA